MCVRHVYMMHLRPGYRLPWLHFAAPVYSRDDMAYGAMLGLRAKLNRVRHALRPAVMRPRRSLCPLSGMRLGLFFLCCNYVSVPQTRAAIGWNS